jgi:poly-gamma-glutamate system protein
MKKLYWRPSGISRIELVLIATLSVICLVSIQTFQIVQRQPYFSSKVAAARLALTSMQAIKAVRVSRGLVIDPEVDPTASGMIGENVTDITSNTGHLPAKQLSTNPNYAAVLVSMLKRAGVERGDVVAMGVSGSFPALNAAAYAALQTLEAKPIVIVSVSGSEWGATDPNYTWLDMESTLHDQGLITFRAVAGSRGGIDDRGFGISKRGRGLLDAAVKRAAIRKLEPVSLDDSIAQRMNIYYEMAADRPIGAYINIGGGSASVGTAVGKRLFNPGLNRSAPRGATDSVMTRFVRDGIPVIHLSGIAKIAERYGLSADTTKPSPPGEGGVYTRIEYSPWYALASIVAIIGLMFAFLRLDVGANLLGSARASSK